jgi:hypothetical protein
MIDSPVVALFAQRARSGVSAQLHRHGNPDGRVRVLLSLRKAHCVFGIFAAFASPGTTSGTPTERVAKGDNALKLINASGVPDAIRHGHAAKGDLAADAKNDA